jgi:PAS domain-containing protein
MNWVMYRGFSLLRETSQRGRRQKSNLKRQTRISSYTLEKIHLLLFKLHLIRYVRYARSLIEASLDPLVTISPSGKITDVNCATEEVTGESRTKLIGSDFSSYFTEPEKAQEGYQQVFSKGSVTDYPLAIRHTSKRITDVLYPNLFCFL